MLEKIQAWDEKILLNLTHKRTSLLNKIMILITTVGNHGYIWFVFAAPFLVMNRWRITGFTILVALCFTWLGGEVTIKHIVGRVRPCNKSFEEYLLIENPPHYSFPSGHSSSSFAVSVVMFFMCQQLFIPVFIFAALMAFSRMYLLVHYPTDVIAGALFGVICGCVAVPVSAYIPFFDFVF